MLCATSTIAQGLNFPVSSVFLASRFVPHGQISREIGAREFWNLAGRAGRLDHDSVGVIGLCESHDRKEIIEFLSRHTGALVSRLVVLLDQLSEERDVAELSEVLWKDQWEDFRSYVAHLWAEKKNLDAVLVESEQLLRQTYGYTSMRNDPERRHKADALLSATKLYVQKLSKMPPGTAELADSTGFSPEGVGKAMYELQQLENKLQPSDWAPESLFGEGGRIADLFGVMLHVRQLEQDLKSLSGPGFERNRISDITRDWVNGEGIKGIAKKYFASDKDDEADTIALTKACRAIYRTIVNSGTWGISALSQVSGVDFESLSEAEKRKINAVPAMIYHGVRSEEAVLMRMNSAPRTVAESLGALYREMADEDKKQYSVGDARSFLKKLNTEEWNEARPEGAPLSGTGYKRIWEILSGEGN